MTITCIVADDHPVVRHGIRLRLEHVEGIRVLAEAHDGPSALALVKLKRPDVAVLDLQLPGLSGIEVAALLQLANEITTRTVIVSAFAAPAMVDKAFACGVDGYVSKLGASSSLAAAVEALASGQRYVDPLIAAEYMNPTLPVLSDRERQILELMAQGKQNPTIAFELSLASETVKSNVSKILDKLDSESRTEAVATALRQSLIL